MTGTACTRWGKPAPVPPTIAPLSAIYVDADTGSDTTGNGSSSKPYKTLTKAVEVLGAAKVISTTGVTIYLASGIYDAAKGEEFPIVVPRPVTISGNNFNSGIRAGTFINGSGEDKIFEELVHAPARSDYTTLEVPPGVTGVSFSDLYIGAAKLKLPNSGASYVSVDALGMLSAGDSSFAAGTVSRYPNVSGILVAGGTLDCDACQVHGNFFGIGGLSVPVASSTSAPSGSPVPPSVSLTKSSGDAILSARVADILTDGSIDVSAQEQTFEQGRYAFEDGLRPVISVPTRGTLDFGGGGTSTGGNIFIGARISEIGIVKTFEAVDALDDTWNPRQQGANRSGQYTRIHKFHAGVTGKNVTIVKSASGSIVTVGPAPVPTPTPSSTPSTSPSATPT